MKSIAYEKYLDKVYGCFVGKAISGNIGAPHEGVKMPMELQFMPEMINCELPNDDLDLQVLWLDVVEKKGENKLYVRITRGNRDTKMNVMFTYGPMLDEHNISLASKNPYYF